MTSGKGFEDIQETKRKNWPDAVNRKKKDGRNNERDEIKQQRQQEALWKLKTHNNQRDGNVWETRFENIYQNSGLKLKRIGGNS